MFGTIEKYSGLLFFLDMSSSFADSFAFLVGINQLLILALSIPLEYVKLFFSFLERTCLLHFDTIQLFAICTTVTVILHSLIITSVQLKRIQGSSRMVAADSGKGCCLGQPIIWGQNQSSQKWIQPEPHFLRGALWCVTWWRRKYHLFLTVLLHLSQRTSPPTVCMFKIC